MQATTYSAWCCLQMLDLELLSSENLASISAERPAAENTAMLQQQHITAQLSILDNTQHELWHIIWLQHASSQVINMFSAAEVYRRNALHKLMLLVFQ